MAAEPNKQRKSTNKLKQMVSERAVCKFKPLLLPTPDITIDIERCMYLHGADDCYNRSMDDAVAGDLINESKQEILIVAIEGAVCKWRPPLLKGMIFPRMLVHFPVTLSLGFDKIIDIIGLCCNMFTMMNDDVAEDNSTNKLKQAIKERAVIKWRIQLILILVPFIPLRELHSDDDHFEEEFYGMDLVGANYNKSAFRFSLYSDEC